MKINYSVRKSLRAKRVRLTVRPGGRVVVTTPMGVSSTVVEHFLAQKNNWLERAVAKMRLIVTRSILPRTNYASKRNEAKHFISRRVTELNKLYGFVYQGITIRNQKTRWGSCSRKGNLSFNYRLVLLPPQLADYVIVHELCHIAEFNHSKNFWALVKKVIPEAARLRRELRYYDLRLT